MLSMCYDRTLHPSGRNLLRLVPKHGPGQPLTALAIGYAAAADSLPENLRARDLSPRTRKPLREFVFSGTWSNPSAAVAP